MAKAFNLSKLPQETKTAPHPPPAPEAETPPPAPEDESASPPPPPEQPESPELLEKIGVLEARVAELNTLLAAQKAAKDAFEKLAKEQAGFLNRLKKTLEILPGAKIAPAEIPDICRDLGPDDLAAVYELHMLNHAGEVFKIKGHHVLSDATTPGMLPDMPRIFESNLYTLIFKAAMKRFYVYLNQFVPGDKAPLPSGPVSYDTVKDVQQTFSQTKAAGFVGDDGK